MPKATITKESLFIMDALKKQFSIIGLKYSPETVKKDGWYSKHTWTPKQRDAFRDWFFSEAQKRLRWRRKVCLKEWEHWNLMYGWKDGNDTDIM